MIVDIPCGMAVLRGADIFKRGILSAQTGKVYFWFITNLLSFGMLYFKTLAPFLAYQPMFQGFSLVCLLSLKKCWQKIFGFLFICL